MNHPVLTTPAAQARLARAATHKPSNSDVYTRELGEFVTTFQRVLGDPRLPYLFLIEGGALAVENALKTAFDWKSRRNEAEGRSPELGMQALHLTGAFHGRTGYTMSLTNTDPNKTARFPTFRWPRIDTPALQHPLAAHAGTNRAAEDVALEQAAAAFAANPHDIACTVLEPIQGEGGDRHLSPRFLRELQTITHANDALFVLDEVQTGVGMTGTAWAYQQLDVEPDVVAFGKKTHVCGIMAGGRLDEVEGHVFATSSRINSTFGGGLVDMVRATMMLEAIEAEQLIPRAATLGEVLRSGLEELAERHPAVTNARGRGLFCAIDLPGHGDAGRGDPSAVHRRARLRPGVWAAQHPLPAATDHLERGAAGRCAPHRARHRPRHRLTRRAAAGHPPRHPATRRAVARHPPPERSTAWPATTTSRP
jgi:L-lysine 6-transaminase